MEDPDDTIEICEVKLSVPSFRTKSRLVAKLSPAYWHGENSEKHCVRFVLEYQHEGEPGHWLDDPSFPWHGRNLDSLIKAVVRHHHKIEALL